MMYRSIFFNCWIALIVFTLYFIKTIYQTGGAAAPISTIAFSFFWAGIAFVFAYVLRAFLDYILYTPEHIEISMETEGIHNISSEVEDEATSGSTLSMRNNTTIEFQDESSEDIAQVVRTMLHRDEPFIEK